MVAAVCLVEEVLLSPRYWQLAVSQMTCLGVFGCVEANREAEAAVMLRLYCVNIHLVIHNSGSTYAELPGTGETAARGDQELGMISIAAGCTVVWRSQEFALTRSH